jgi:4-carboxymuconolactone decarboxylase
LHPEVAAKLLGFQAAESTSTGLSPSVREVVIIVLGAVYGADYELYQDTESAFGAKGLFDIAAVMGVYHTVCTMLTLFEVPAP